MRFVRQRFYFTAMSPKVERKTVMWWLADVAEVGCLFSVTVEFQRDHLKSFSFEVWRAVQPNKPYVQSSSYQIARVVQAVRLSTMSAP